MPHAVAHGPRPKEGKKAPRFPVQFEVESKYVQIKNGSPKKWARLMVPIGKVSAREAGL